MEAHEGPRRFSASSALARPLLDDGVDKRHANYGAIVADEEDALVEREGEEIETSPGKETKLLVKVRWLCISMHGRGTAKGGAVC